MLRDPLTLVEALREEIEFQGDCFRSKAPYPMCPGLLEEAADEIERLHQVRVAALEEAASAAEALDRSGREWVPDSLWANVKADTARAIRALASKEA